MGDDIIRKVEFIDWLGEQRPFYGDKIGSVPPTPTPTPSVTPTITPTITPTSTSTSTPTPTLTSTNTPTLTETPTPTTSSLVGVYSYNFYQEPNNSDVCNQNPLSQITIYTQLPLTPAGPFPLQLYTDSGLTIPYSPPSTPYFLGEGCGNTYIFIVANPNGEVAGTAGTCSNSCPPTPTPSATIALTPSNTATATLTHTPTPSSTPTITSSGLILHLDASSLDNFVIESSGGIDRVSTWIDLSPKNNSVTQATSFRKPIIETDGYGSYKVTFDGGNDNLTSSTISNIASGITALTKFIVFETSVFNEEWWVDDSSPINTDTSGYYVVSSSTWAPLWYPGPRWYDFSGITKSPNYITWATKATSVGSMSGQTNDQSNTNVLFDTWGPDPAITRWTLGTNQALQTQYAFTGSIKELLIYDRELSSAEIQTIYNILKTKWNYSSW